MLLQRVLLACLIYSLVFFTVSNASTALAETTNRGGSSSFDDNVTPDVIFGTGNTNGGFTIDRRNGIEVGLRAKLRFDASGNPQDIFNSNGDGTYSFTNRSRPNFPQGADGEWAFDWSINTNYDLSTSFNLDDLTYELGLDGDPGPGTDFLTFDPIALPTVTGGDFWDHSIGDNSTLNDQGTEATNNAEYVTLTALNNVAQNSWRYGFGFIGVPTNYNPRVPGSYTIYLQVQEGSTVLARSEIEVIVTDPALEFDQNITPDVIFGDGNINGAFTADRRNDIEIALRGKLRFDSSGQPQDIFNSNGDGTYSFNPGAVPGQTDPNTAEWSFDWGVNTNFNAASGPNLDAYTYEIGMDGDPSPATDFLVFDPITPTSASPIFDHAIGTNSTGNGAGVQAANPTDYANLIGSNNVAQNSWRYDFFNDGPFAEGPLGNFDPAEEGTYTVYILARDAEDVVVARSQIQFLIGSAVAGDVAEVSLEKIASVSGAQMIGDTFSYTFTVSNTDVATTEDLELVDTLPDNLTLVGSSCDDGTQADVAGQTLTFDLIELTSGQSTVCTIDVEVTGPNLIVNEASVSATNDFDPMNNAASVTLVGGNVQSVDLTGDTPTAADNDYTRINDAIQNVQAGDVIMLEGTFDWTENEAFNRWALGSNGIADGNDVFVGRLPHHGS